MKKGQIFEGKVTGVAFPNKGIVETEEGKVIVKNTIPGQTISFAIQKKRAGRVEGRLLSVLEPSPLETAEQVCPHFGACGGCNYQSLPYEAQLSIKESQVHSLLDSVVQGEYRFEGIAASPRQYGYRNKMEFSFGDQVKDGPLALGMHKRGSTYDVITVSHCAIVDQDYRTILAYTLSYFQKKGTRFYKKMSHEGVLRHLLVRKAVKTGDILVDLVTTSQEDLVLEPYVDGLLQLELEGTIAGIQHTINDSVADVVQSDRTITLYGRDYICEELLGLFFQITTFSFFQTNSLGAEVLYQVVRNYIGDTRDKSIFDLYSGTGTIAQILAPVAKKVIGVEIVEEAVQAARLNAELNGLENCEFIAGDVLKVLDSLTEKPDMIVLDPPRDGIHPKALEKILRYGVDRIVYVSCKPTSLVRDLEVIQQQGYRVEKVKAVDMFPGTCHVETVVLLSQQKPDDVIEVEIELDEPEDIGILARLARKEPANYVSIAMRPGGLQDYVNVWNELN